MGVQQYMQTYFYSQSDCQTERLKLVVEDVLRHLSAHLKMIRIFIWVIWNLLTTTHEIPGTLPFQLLHWHHRVFLTRRFICPKIYHFPKFPAAARVPLVPGKVYIVGYPVSADGICQ
jgi:hypothetical protein